jgi:hypothetical protein
MKNPNTLGSHLFPDGAPSRVIHQDGLTIYHQRCLRCGRDFAQGMNGGGWQSVYVGFLRIELLVNTVTDQWLAERCPGMPLWAHDAEARALRHA